MSEDTCPHDANVVNLEGGGTMEKRHRWTRTITVEGPVDWVNAVIDTSLSDGVHLCGATNGHPKMVTVHTDESKVEVYFSDPTTVKTVEEEQERHVMAHIENDPERYAEVAKAMGLNIEKPSPSGVGEGGYV